MRIYNICTKKTYQKDGTEKNAWLQVGRLIKFDATEDKPAQMKIELSMFPTTAFYVFEPKPKEDAPKKVDATEVSPEEIPF